MCAYVCTVSVCVHAGVSAVLLLWISCLFLESMSKDEENKSSQLDGHSMKEGTIGNILLDQP